MTSSVGVINKYCYYLLTTQHLEVTNQSRSIETRLEFVIKSTRCLQETAVRAEPEPGPPQWRKGPRIPPNQVAVGFISNITALM